MSGLFIVAVPLVGKTGELLFYNMSAYCKNNPVNMSDPYGYYAGTGTEEEEAMRMNCPGYSLTGSSSNSGIYYSREISNYESAHWWKNYGIHKAWLRTSYGKRRWQGCCTKSNP